MAEYIWNPPTLDPKAGRSQFIAILDNLAKPCLKIKLNEKKKTERKKEKKNGCGLIVEH